MVRLTWRDLTRTESPGDTAASGEVRDSGTSGSRDAPDPATLLGMAAQAPASPLAGLLAERARLEANLASLTGQTSVPGGSSRFPVTNLAERRAEIDAWARARDAGTSGPDAKPRTPQADPAPQASRPPRSDAAATRPIEVGLTRDAADQAGGSRSALWGNLRSGLNRYEEVTGPARQLGRQVTGFADKLDDLDRKLAREGVSQSERDEIRRQLGGSTVNHIAGPIRRADEALARPRQVVEEVANRWQQAEKQVSSGLDQYGGYATSRDRALGIDTGGSGDLFARADDARERALDRRAEKDREERRAEERHERQHDRRVAEQQEAERLDRRGAQEKGADHG
jgi:hypothetical protein